MYISLLIISYNLYKLSSFTCSCCYEGFGANLNKAFVESNPKDWAIGLKTHDHHKLLQWIYPVAIKGLGSKHLQEALMDLGILLRY